MSSANTNTTINSNTLHSGKDSSGDAKTELPSLNDNSNPQQGAPGHGIRTPPTTNRATFATATQHRTPLKIPPTVKDARKLFVGGLPSDVTSDEFRAFFQQFGEVVDSVVMFDRVTTRSRGFGFVTFDDAAVCNRLLDFGHVEMRSKLVEIKSAEPKAANAACNNNRGMSSPAMNEGPSINMPALEANLDGSLVISPPLNSPSTAFFPCVPLPPFYPANFGTLPLAPLAAPGVHFAGPPMMPCEQNEAYFAPYPYAIPNGSFGFVPVYYPPPDASYFYPESVMQEVAPGIPAKPEEDDI